MKKLLLTAAVALAAGSAFAAVPDQLFLIGGPNAWEPELGTQMTKVEAGIFSLKDVVFSDNPYFAFTSELGSWEVINANRYAPAEKDATFVTDGANAMQAGVDASWSIEPGTYDLYVNCNTMLAATTLEATMQGGGTEGGWTVYYTNPSKFESVYAYTYGGDGGEVLGSWPGTAMTFSNNVWSVSADAVPEYIIFNNGEGGNENQTADLVFEAGKTYSDPSKADANGGDVPEGPGPETSVEAPAQLYLIGSPTGWTETDGMEMTLLEKGIFFIENVDMPDETSYFAFTAVLGSWADINANRVAPAEKDAEFNTTEGNDFVWGVDASWAIPAGTYSFYVNFNTMKVATTLEAGVKTIGAELNGEEVIYNLNGLRVNRENLTPGIYVVNGKKTVIR